MSFLELMEQLRAFRDARDWKRFHTAKDLSAALAVEAGELQERFLWLEDSVADHLAASSSEVAGEVADVLIYALQFCLRFGLDPESIVTAKIARNEERFPA